MRIARRMSAWALSSLGTLMVFGNYVAGVALHLYTILVAFKVSGFIAAGLALVLPFFAEAYWFIAFWWKMGTVLNGYSFYVLLYVIWFIIGVGAVWLGAAITPSDEEARAR